VDRLVGLARQARSCSAVDSRSQGVRRRSRCRERRSRCGPITRTAPRNMAGSCETPQTEPPATVVRSTPSAPVPVRDSRLRPADSCDFGSASRSPIVHESSRNRPLSGGRHFGAVRLRHEPIAFLCDRSDDRSMGRRRRARANPQREEVISIEQFSPRQGRSAPG
jgi:hypothetical protein